MTFRDPLLQEHVEQGLIVVRARMREAIKKIGFKAAATATGKSKETLHRCLKGTVEPQAYVLARLATAIGKTPSRFFEPTENQTAGDQHEYERRVQALRLAMRCDR